MGKLVNDISQAQFDSLVKVLSRLSIKRDVRYLLMPPNLQEVFNHLEDFILLKVPQLNFQGLGDARAREKVKVVFLPELRKHPRRWREVTLEMRIRSSL